jgi:hypothetical protein
MRGQGPDTAEPCRATETWPLYGLAICGACGQTMRPVHLSGIPRAYECRGCRLSRADADTLEVLACFTAFAAGADAAESITRTDLPALFASRYDGVVVLGGPEQVRFVHRTA